MVAESLAERIEILKEQRNAIILVHNYQRPEIQDIADVIGDSLELSRRAAATDADVIVFCGVHFMAETASILSPDKTVLLPDRNAGCPMADMIGAEDVRQLKRDHPGAVVVCYVNSSAEVKAESDYCCTSANAVDVVRSLPDGQKIIFVPDKYLGQYVSRQTGRDLILWNGYCPTHVYITESDVQRCKQDHPQAAVMVHPECVEPVCRLADDVLSTGGMCRYARTADATEFIVGTENGIIHRLERENPDKRFYPASDRAVCPNMKLIDLEKVLWSLEDIQFEVKLPAGIRSRARQAVDRMIDITGASAGTAGRAAAESRVGG